MKTRACFLTIPGANYADEIQARFKAADRREGLIGDAAARVIETLKGLEMCPLPCAEGVEQFLREFADELLEDADELSRW